MDFSTIILLVILSMAGMSVPAGKQTYDSSSGQFPDYLVGQKVDIILRPSLDVGVYTVDCFDIWGDEIICPDVMLEEKK